MEVMKTKADMQALTEAEKLTMTKQAKSGTWYDDEWQPYCSMCSTMGRMTKKSYGFECEGKGDHFNRKGCGNIIGFDLTRLKESPLNT